MQITDIVTSLPFVTLNNPEGTGTAGGEGHMGGRTEFLNFLVCYEDLESFIAQVCGVPTQFGTGTGATITQQVPLAHPRVPKCYAQSFSYRSVTIDDHVTFTRPFAKAAVTVNFGTFDYDLGDGSTPWIRLRASGSSDVITLPGVAFAFSNGEKIEQDQGRIVGQVAYEVTRFQVPSFDQWDAVARPLLGCVNSTAVTISKTVFPAGYLLFPTYGLDSQTNVLGTPQNQVSFPVIYRSLQWNYGMRSDGVYDSIVPAPYPTADLNALVT